MERKIRILIADDHVVVRESMAKALAAEPGFEIAGQAADGGAAAAFARARACDVALLDIDMPGLDCFEAARRIIEALPEAKIVFLSALGHDRHIERALASGAAGYLLKTEPTAAVAEAIRAAARGERRFSEAIERRLIPGPGGPRLAPGEATRASALTSREVEVLRHLARGMSKKEIAAAMTLAVKTIDAHTANIMEKLGIHDRVELARFAIREGIAEA